MPLPQSSQVLELTLAFNSATISFTIKLVSPYCSSFHEIFSLLSECQTSLPKDVTFSWAVCEATWGKP